MRRFAILTGLLALGIGLALFLRALADSPGSAAASPGIVRPADAEPTSRGTETVVRPAPALSAPEDLGTATRTTATAAETTARKPRPGAPANLRGTVVSTEGPLAGCQLLLLDGERALSQVDTDATGAFALRIPAPPSSVKLRVFLRGHVPYELLVEGLVPGETRMLGNVHIGRGLLLTGVVLTQRGKPLPGALVTVRQPGRGVRSNQHVQETRTGSDGRFHLPDAPRGAIQLHASHETEGASTLTLMHEDERELTLRLERLRRLAVRVLGREGEPVEGADLVLTDENRRSLPRQGKTDAEGRFRFEELGSMPVNLRVSADGFKPESRTALVPVITNAEDGDGAHEVVVNIMPWPCLTGRVVTPDGKSPPEGTTVQALPTGPDGVPAPVGFHAAMEVQPDGSFRICNVKSARFVVRVIAPGYARTDSAAVRVAMRDDVSVGELELRPGGTLALALASEAGPVVGGRVDLYLRTPPPMARWTSGRTQGLPPYRHASTDAEGRVEFAHLAAGDYWVVADAPELVASVVGPLQVVDGRRTDRAALRLRPGSLLSGVVLDSEDEPVADAVVLLSGNPGVHGTIQVQADANGLFRTPALPPGPWQLQARSMVRRARTSGEAKHVNLKRGEPAEVRLEL